jgi:hypothetical protein
MTRSQLLTAKHENKVGHSSHFRMNSLWCFVRRVRPKEAVKRLMIFVVSPIVVVWSLRDISGMHRIPHPEGCSFIGFECDVARKRAYHV